MIDETNPRLSFSAHKNARIMRHVFQLVLARSYTITRFTMIPNLSVRGYRFADRQSTIAIDNHSDHLTICKIDASMRSIKLGVFKFIGSLIKIIHADETR